MRAISVSRVSRSRLFQWLTAIIVTVVAVVLYSRWRPETLAQGAERLLGCIERADGDCLYRYSIKAEREAMALTPDKLERFVKEYVRPSYAGYKRVGVSPPDEYREQGIYGLAAKLQDTKGRTAYLPAYVNLTDDGPRSDVVTSLVFASIFAHHGSGTAPYGKQKIEVLGKGMEADRATLESLGIFGFVETTSNTFVKWETYIKYAKRRLATWDKVEAKRREEQHRP